MAEREVHWTWSRERVPLGASDTRVPKWVKLDGPGLKGAPDLHVRFEIRDGVPEVVDFRLTATEDGRAIRTADLRVFALDGLAYNAFVRVPDERPDGRHWQAPPEDERRHWRQRKAYTDARARRPGVTPGELEDVARVYRENVGGRPTEAVQLWLGTSHRTAARRIQQARAAGLLPPTSPGKRKA